ncbi:MAG: GNAT family N-acetyltransferase [Deltaproteobacteria bacterium]|nr:GNAT family N-acetyltransferase [Deltaproteobacteria bacterium]
MIEACTDRLHINAADDAEAADYAALHRDNAVHFAPWDPPRPPHWSTRAWWADALARSDADARLGRGARLSLRLRAALGDASAGTLVGTIGVSAVERGPFQNARLGYKLAERFVGHGLMHEALVAVLDACFGPLGLHRVEANHMPENVRSAAVLDRLGFERHGIAEAYLQIGPDGAFRDHVLRSTRAERWSARRAR